MINNKEDYYFNSIKKVTTYIESHFHQEISNQQLAQIAHFSEFHFQRIFKTFTKESPYEYLIRVRLEHAAKLLIFRKQLRVSEVAFQSGFGSLENFSRQFKKRFDQSPSAFRKKGNYEKRKIDQIQSKDDFYLVYQEIRKSPIPHFETSIETWDSKLVAQISSVFGADGSPILAAYDVLVKWAEKSFGFNQTEIVYGMSIDNPDITPSNLYRYDFALECNVSESGPAKIYLDEIPGGEYVIVHVVGDIYKVAQAWDYLYKIWLPSSGYQPRNHPAIERFLERPEIIGWEKYDMDCCIPIQKI